ncbi:ABC transporter ATP-binding protein [Georhizobium profundi]|jgi:capsular polysaccharide transport system ATP-binding protein|uniref:ABC transporter ATP-binding protein n=1 Tax=Georhizobium profundi TaxID=2341112 RepID=A0A3S9B6I4_9HYPH|nr:ABC transporter ATP-binding protein [Georhizobium profundi]AZN72534.1 ABC transporter ATP-binding protein [Georhizobium profundi]
METTVELRNVTKYYKTEGRKKMILDKVSLAFERGYSYAILGVNGAGKSTTLRLISGSELPNSGKIKRNVRVSWPLGFAGGFHPMMSGRDNLKFVARAYGADVGEVTEFVEDFAELGDYIKAPIKTYSSGMSARLAFGLSMAIEFDCYLIDEITAVGDARFQAKCRKAFLRRQETADLIVVSHSMSTVKSYCQRGIVLVDGHPIYFDDVENAIETYYRLNR